MDELVASAGDIETLYFDVEWERSRPGGTATDATRGELRLLVRGHPVWFGLSPDAGFEWTWVEVLEFLANAWPFLTLEDSPPFGLDMGTPSQLRSEAAKLAGDSRGEVSDFVLSELESFLEVHDLSRALEGAILPEVLFVRVGQLCCIYADTIRVEIPIENATQCLESFGQLLADRLANAVDDRGRAAVAFWHNRTELSPIQQASIATGLSGEALDSIAGSVDVSEYWQVDGTAPTSNELLAAARMSADLTHQEIGAIVGSIKGSARRETARLDRLSDEAHALLAKWGDSPPHDQGHELARWLRAVLELGEAAPANPDGILEDLGVLVEAVDLSTTTVDAVGTWGPNHGPAVFVNLSGRHSQEPAGRRTTLAHELAHLLVDRRGALPLTEVLGGRSSWRNEARARAFAAELLLPCAFAGLSFGGADDPSEVLSRLKREFGVSAEVVAWQAKNSGIPLAPDAFALLRGLVRYPGRF